MRIALLLLLLPALALPALAGTESTSSCLLARLGSPADPDAVSELVADANAADPGQGIALADALANAGGAAAVDGLVDLLDDSDQDVRRAALRGLARLELRTEAAVVRTRRILEESATGETVVAVEALGHIGDGRDMPRLLELAKSEDAPTRRSAFRAMAKLSGAKVPFLHVRWTYYWKSFHVRASLLLSQALVALRTEPDAGEMPALLHVVGQYGWVDLPKVRQHLSRWICEPDRDLRVAACVLARELRVADFVPELESALNFAGCEHLRAEVECTLDALGVPRAEPGGSPEPDVPLTPER